MVNCVRAYYYLQSMKKRAFWPRHKLEIYVNKRLRQIVKHAYDNVPFYHNKFKEAGMKPEKFQGVEDLKKLPILSKDELRSNLDQMIARNYDASKLKTLRTSGSTGQPLYFFITNKEDEFRKARHLRANIACGQRLRDRWVTITSPIYFNQTTKFQRILGIYAPLSVSVFSDAATQISIIRKLRPDVLDGYASSLFLLSKEVQKRGIDDINPRFLISGADIIDAVSRQFVEKVFDASFFDQYGAAEFERLAWQCKEKNGYHIDADSVVMEFLDENGEEVAPGETGEIVCTSLFNYAMPFIRYKVGDVGSASRDSECPCGISFPLMKVFEGRKDSFVVLPDGRVLSPLAIGDAMCMFKYFRNIYQYRFIQRRIDAFKILIDKKDESVEDKIMEIELLKHILRVLKLSSSQVTIDAEFVSEVPLDKSGKIRKVVSELEN